MADNLDFSKARLFKDSIDPREGPKIYLPSKYLQSPANLPLFGGKILIVPKSDSELYLRRMRDDPAYFRLNSIVGIRVISDEEYMRLIRKLHETGAYGPPISADEILEQREKDLKAATSIYRDPSTGELLSEKQMDKLIQEGKVDDIIETPLDTGEISTETGLE